MCTAATYKTNDLYFGRTFDYEFSYGEEAVVTPRNYVFEFRKMGRIESHYAMIGIAYVADNYPLYYEAVNERGLGMAGLNFSGNADYKEVDDSRDNITPFEFIPWILSQCDTVSSARKLLDRINIVNIAFSDHLPLTDLHWMISDENESIVVECAKAGLKVYDNPAGVMTNNPPFDKQLFSLNNYRRVSAKQVENTMLKDIELDEYSRGMGGLGLPGDLSSQSRFVRVAFVRANSLSGSDEISSVNQFFHILGSVEQARGCCDLGNDKYEITIYTSCYSTRKGILYYTCYGNHQITGVDMNEEDLDGNGLYRYPLVTEEHIHWVNKQ